MMAASYTSWSVTISETDPVSRACGRAGGPVKTDKESRCIESRSTPSAARCYALGMRWLAAVLLFLALQHAPLDAQQLGSSVEVPSGASMFLTAQGEGVQIYTCTAVQDGAKWVLEGPDAKLHDAKGRQIGTHFKGPTWQLNDGSRVVGEPIASQPSPDPGAVAWLLLRARAGSATGSLAGVTFIRRTGTHGGMPLAKECQNPADVGKKVEVPYSATYTFYAGGR
jgi:hypothetical protein